MQRGDEVAEIIGGLFASAVGCGFVLLIIAFAVVIWWRIFSKAGYSGALGLLMIIPLVNLVLMCILAFAQWPIERELENLRNAAPRVPPAPIPPGPTG